MLAEIQAESLAKAMNLQKRVSNSQITKQEDKYFKVNVGKFKFKLGALELCEKLRQLGFNAYVIKE